MPRGCHDVTKEWVRMVRCDGAVQMVCTQSIAPWRELQVRNLGQDAEASPRTGLSRAHEQALLRPMDDGRRAARHETLSGYVHFRVTQDGPPAASSRYLPVQLGFSLHMPRSVSIQEIQVQSLDLRVWTHRLTARHQDERRGCTTTRGCTRRPPALASCDLEIHHFGLTQRKNP